MNELYLKIYKALGMFQEPAGLPMRTRKVTRAGRVKKRIAGLKALPCSGASNGVIRVWVSIFVGDSQSWYRERKVLLKVGGTCAVFLKHSWQNDEHISTL